MEKMKDLPLYRRFGFLVLFFNVILILSISGPLWIIWKGDYKNLMDRIRLQSRLFRYCTTALNGVSSEDWEDVTELLPRLLASQRILIFRPDGSTAFDSGIMVPAEDTSCYDLWLPHPYISPGEEQNSSHLIETLKSVPEFREKEYGQPQHAMLNVREDTGLDRLILHARGITTSQGEWHLLVLSSSVVDILLQTRAVKERMALLLGIVLILGALLTLILTRSVTGPFHRLYRYAQSIQEGREEKNGPYDLMQRGEIGEICRTLRNLIQKQYERADNFRNFSSDAVHELKTPLTAIRSGLELYAESDNKEEREEIYRRINKRIRQMAALMDEIEQLGKLETDMEREYCGEIGQAVLNLAEEFEQARLILKISQAAEKAAAPLSAEKLCKILRNLLENAVSFSPTPGSVSLTVGIQSDTLWFTVADQGPGIAEEVRDKLAERFFTYRTGGRKKHSGLGLSIVAAITESCGGHLTYGNREGIGAFFRIEIPAIHSLGMSRDMNLNS